jgi:hypothetical protein
MVKKMPLKWIEQAEARQVCVMAISERRPMPRLPLVATSLRSSLVRLRSWIAPPDPGSRGQPTDAASVGGDCSTAPDAADRQLIAVLRGGG